ncbi:MAG: arylsulfatase [Verrucomicrobiota bacterium]
MIRLILLCWIALIFLSAGFANDNEGPPNIIVIFADDLGYGDLSCYGAELIKTPNIDRLASEGRHFTDAHTPSPVCSPSRYCLLTGKYAFRNGFYSPVFLRAGLQIEQEQTTIPALLGRAGYASACIGKWHLGFGKKTPDWNGELKPGPLEVGFDYYFGVPVVNSHPPFVWVENHRVVGLVEEDPLVYGREAVTEAFPEKLDLDMIGGAEAAHALYQDRDVAETLTEKSIEWIEENQDRPFFLYLSTTHIHHPFTPAERFLGTSEAGVYGDFVHELDWMVGEIMTSLEERELSENTLILFTSDNGGMFNSGGQEAWKLGHRPNGPLLGFKFGAWEGGHRVPFIARWPGQIPPGSTSDELISTIDLLATFAAIAGVALKNIEGPDSFNILPALIGEPQQPIRDHLIISPMKHRIAGLRFGDWLFINGRGSGGYDNKRDTEYVRGGPGAFLLTEQSNSDIEGGEFRPDAPPAQLYNLEEDLSQTTNLFESNPEQVKRMRALLRRHRQAERTAPER